MPLQDIRLYPAHIEKAAAGHGHGEKTEQPFLQGVKRVGEVEGDPDREEPDGEMHQVGMQWNRLREIFRAEGVGDVVDRRSNRGKQCHDSTPSRMASITGIV